MKICAATGNAGKLRELRRILEAQGHEVVSQKELGITIEPDETGTTFAENALIKAETICKASGLPTIAENAEPIRIGNNVWIGCNVTIIGGVTVGNDVVIGAGSVVTRDIPAGVIAFGNPCRVIRPVTEDDRITEVV